MPGPYARTVASSARAARDPQPPTRRLLDPRRRVAGSRLVHAQAVVAHLPHLHLAVAPLADLRRTGRHDRVDDQLVHRRKYDAVDPVVGGALRQASMHEVPRVPVRVTVTVSRPSGARVQPGSTERRKAAVGW